MKVLASLSVQIFLFVFFCCSPLSHSSASGPSKRSLHVIVFESYVMKSGKQQGGFDKLVWPNSDFPAVFSRLITLSGTEEIQLPSGFSFPKNLMFVDIHTFDLPITRSDQKRSYSRRNDITAIAYKLSAVFSSEDRCAITLEGHHEDFKLPSITVETGNNVTQLAKIQRSANRVLYFALTLMPPANQIEEKSRPKLVKGPAPEYPSQLVGSKWVGNVQILCTVSAAGKIDPHGFILLECPHLLFARKSLELILNRWEFVPAIDSGIPVSARVRIEVPFLDFSPKLQIPMTVPRY
jgi:hypothetical protein